MTAGRESLAEALFQHLWRPAGRFGDRLWVAVVAQLHPELGRTPGAA